MGFAIISKNMDFRGASLGKITPVKNVPVIEFHIKEIDEILGSQQMEIDYLPSNTSQREVTWSIVEGEEYAIINPNDGWVNTIANGTIVVRAVSVYNQDIYDEISVNVNTNDVIDIDWIGTCGGNYLDLGIKVPEINSFDLEMVAHSRNTWVAFGTRKAATTNVFQGIYSSATNAISFRTTWNEYLNEYKWNSYNGSSFNKDDVIRFFANRVDNSNILYVNDKQIANTNTTGTVNAEPIDNIYLFDINQGGVPSQKKDDFACIRKCVITNTNNEVIMDLKPVLYKNIPCFYDSVQSRFLYIQGDEPIYYLFDGEELFYAHD